MFRFNASTCSSSGLAPTARVAGIAAGALDQATQSVHDHRPGADQGAAGMDQVKVALPLRAAVTDGRQQTRIVRGEPRQLLGIVAVVLGLAGGDGADLAGVSYQNLMTKLLQQPADPGRVSAALQSDPHGRFALEVTP